LCFPEAGQVFPKLRYRFNKPHRRLADLPDLDEPAKEEFQCNVVTKRYLLPDGENIIRVRYWDNFLDDGSTPNHAVETVINNSSRYVHDWRGPLVCHGMKNGYSTAMDLDTTGFQHIIDYFNTSRHKPDPADPMKAVQQLHEEIAT
jgi:hypothetical protein